MFQFLKQRLAQGAVWGGPPKQDAKPPASVAAPPSGSTPQAGGPLPPQQAIAQIFGGLGSWFTDQTAVEGALSGQSEGDAARIQNGFSARAGQSLSTTLSEELPPASFAQMLGLMSFIPTEQGAAPEPSPFSGGFVDTDSAEKAYQAASAELDELSEAEKHDPANPVVRRYNDALTLANALKNPEAPVTDAQAELSDMVAATREEERKAAEEATAGKPQLDPEAAARHAQHEAEQAEVRRKTEERERERAQIEQQSESVRLLRRDESLLEGQIREAMKAGDTAAEEKAIAELAAKEAERKRIEEELALARAKLEAEQRAEAEREEAARRAKQRADDEALARSQRELADAQAAAAARAAAEEAGRLAAGDAAIAHQTEKDVAADASAEEQRLAGLSGPDRELHDAGRQAEADLARATAAFDALDEKAKQDPNNEVVRAYNDTLTRANAFQNPDAPVVDAEAEFSGMIAEQTEADRKAEEEKRAGTPQVDPEAAGRRAQGEAELAEQRARAEAADRERAAMTGMEDRLRELGRDDRMLEARIAKMREHGDEVQEAEAVAKLRRVEAEKRELEQRLEAARAEAEARQQAEAAAAAEEQARVEADREAKLALQRQRAAEIEAQRAAEQAQADAERQRAADQALAEKTQKELAAEQGAEEQKLAGMDPADRELYLLSRQAEDELRQRERAVDALPEAEKQNPDNPAVRAYNDALTRANAFKNPEAQVEDMDAGFRSTVAAEEQRVAAEEEARTAGVPQVDPEAAARHAAAEAEQRAQREAAERAEARRQAIAAGERELRELSYQDSVVERRIAQAQADHDELAVEDFAAKLRDIEAARARVEQQIAEAKGQQKAEEEEAARKAAQQRLDEELRRQAALVQQQDAASVAQEQEARHAAEEKERQAELERARVEKTRADEEAEKKAEADKLAGMDEGERVLYLAQKEKKRELDEAEAAMQALPEAERTLDNPLVRRYMDLNDDYNSFTDPHAAEQSRAYETDMKARVEAELAAAMAEEQGKPRVDPETVQRRMTEAIAEQARREARLANEAKLDAMRGEVRDLGKQESEINAEFDRLAALEKQVQASKQPEAQKRQILAQLDAKYDQLARAVKAIQAKKIDLEKKLAPPIGPAAAPPGK